LFLSGEKKKARNEIPTAGKEGKTLTKSLKRSGECIAPVLPGVKVVCDDGAGREKKTGEDQ